MKTKLLDGRRMTRYVHGITLAQFEYFQTVMDNGFAYPPVNSPVAGNLIDAGLLQYDASGELIVLTHKGMIHAQIIRETKFGPPDKRGYNTKDPLSFRQNTKSANAV